MSFLYVFGLIAFYFLGFFIGFYWGYVEQFRKR